jgi:hypothetical protein
MWKSPNDGQARADTGVALATNAMAAKNAPEPATNFFFKANPLSESVAGQEPISSVYGKDAQVALPRHKHLVPREIAAIAD